MAAPATEHRAGRTPVVSWEAHRRGVKIPQAAGRFVFSRLNLAVLTTSQRHGESTLRPVTIKQLLDA
jgi:hypothetical protein